MDYLSTLEGLFCCCLLQSNSLAGHVKINVSRENLFEDSFQQVSFTIIYFSPLYNEYLFIIYIVYLLLHVQYLAFVYAFISTLVL